MRTKQELDQANTNFNKLPDDAWQVIGEMLPIKDRISLSRTGRRAHGLFAQSLKREKNIYFCLSVAQGKQDLAEHLLNGPDAQNLLSTPQTFKDYSERIFTCTAYEYAYWAKDSWMCRMLESHMDNDTKALMFEKCSKMDLKGLSYVQNSIRVENSKHFDFKLLITALKQYTQGFQRWADEENISALHHAWMAVGLELRNMPAHVAHEYCRHDRSFGSIISRFSENLPREISIYNHITKSLDEWFPLSKDLGVKFAFVRGDGEYTVNPPWCSARILSRYPSMDLAAITRLDEVRTAEMVQLLANLHSASALNL